MQLSQVLDGKDRNEEETGAQLEAIYNDFSLDAKEAMKKCPLNKKEGEYLGKTELNYNQGKRQWTDKVDEKEYKEVATALCALPTYLIPGSGYLSDNRCTWEEDEETLKENEIRHNARLEDIKKTYKLREEQQITVDQETEGKKWAE